MTIEEVVKMRDVLKIQENLPLRVFINNSHTIIDESLSSQFTIWDDKNGVLYAFKLVGMQEATSPSNIEGAISVFSVDYEYIEAMEIIRLPINKIGKLIEAIKATGRVISDDSKKQIIAKYEGLLHPERWKLSPTDMNKIISRPTDDAPDIPYAVNENDDYFENKFTVNFKETETGPNRKI